MQRFTIGQRIRLIGGPLHGKAGVVREMHTDGDCAWVEMDAALPGYLVYFDAPERRNWLLVHPSECEGEDGPRAAPLPARDLSPGQLLVGRDG